MSDLEREFQQRVNQIHAKNPRFLYEHMVAQRKTEIHKKLSMLSRPQLLDECIVTGLDVPRQITTSDLAWLLADYLARNKRYEV
jgi:hypothetical protein